MYFCPPCFTEGSISVPAVTNTWCRGGTVVLLLWDDRMVKQDCRPDVGNLQKPYTTGEDIQLLN